MSFARGGSLRKLVLGGAVALLVGCGGGSGTEAESSQPQSLRSIEVTLNGYHGPENVGILMADQRGYFADAGLKVATYSPIAPEVPIPYVVDGTVDLGISHQPQVALAEEKGTPIVTVGTLIPEPTAAMIWLENSKIDGIADLKGKTIGIPGLSFQTDLLARVLARANLSLADVEVQRVAYQMVPTLVDGRVDAIFGGSRNLEGAELEARGLKPVITDVESLGVSSYDELVVVARSNFAAGNSELIRDFMSAVERGAATAIEEPESALAVIERSVEVDPNSTPKGTKAAVEATLPLLKAAAP